MNRIPLEQTRDEVRASRLDLQEQIGIALPVFAYPGGAYDESVVRMLAEEGYELAFASRMAIATDSNAGDWTRFDVQSLCDLANLPGRSL